MVDQIYDKREVCIPGPAGDVTPEAIACRQAAESARDAARAAQGVAESARDEAVSAGTLPDKTVAGLIRTPGSAVRTALLGGSCLIIGDSYAAGFRATSPEARWSTIVCRKMGWTEYNYAVGGTGYALGGDDRFIGQARRARTDGVTPDVVIVAGGRNDGGTYIADAAGELFDYLVATWPASRVIAVPCMWGDYRPVDGTVLSRAYEIRDAAADHRVQVVWDSWQWIYGRPEWCYKMPDGSLDMHPNDAGYSVMAGRTVVAINGGPSSLTMAPVAIPGYNGASNSGATVEIIDGMVHIKGRFDAQSDIYAGWPFAHLYGAWCPGSDRYVIGWTNMGATLCLIKLGADGQCSVNNIYGTPGPNVAFSDIAYPVGIA